MLKIDKQAISLYKKRFFDENFKKILNFKVFMNSIRKSQLEIDLKVTAI
jgi:hypothetical protein